MMVDTDYIDKAIKDHWIIIKKLKFYLKWLKRFKTKSAQQDLLLIREAVLLDKLLEIIN
jgi:hypothetical protein